MTYEEYLVWLQGSFGYRFNDISLLKKALTAPGAEGNKNGTKEERDKYEGNRKQAQMGGSLIPLVVRKKTLYEEDASRSSANAALQAVASRTNHAERAKFLGINKHMRLSVRSRGVAEPNTLNLAMCAILGAVWQDCNEDQSVIGNVVERLFIGTEQQFGVDPRSMYQGALESVDEFVADGVFDNYADVVSSDITLPSSPGSVNNQGIYNTPPETHHEQYYGSSVQIRVPIPRATLSEIDSQEVPVRGVGNISLQPQGDADTPNHEQSFYHVSQHEMGDIQWDNGSGSQASESMSLINGLSRSGSSFLDVPSYEEASLGSPSSIVLQSIHRTPSSDIGRLSQEVLESIESPLQSRRDSIEEIETHLHDETASASNLNASIKKRKPASSRSVSRPSKSTQLDEYIFLEEKRCQSASLPSPGTCVDLAIEQALKTSPTNDETITNLKWLYYAIASPESITGLQEILKVRRRQLAGKETMPGYNLSRVDRVKAIDHLNDKIACFYFLKRCHTYQLYVDSSGGSRKTSDDFINKTTQSVATRSSPQTGNPNNLEDSRVTKLIMSEVYPELKPNTLEYRKKLRSVGDMRKIGQRLDLLVERFGYGILGLLPLPADEPTGQPVLPISNKLLLSFSNSTFKDFVLRLDQLQGDVLRATSKAVSKVVKAIFQGEVNQTSSFGIDRLGQTQIVEYPRGSPELLRLIS